MRAIHQSFWIPEHFTYDRDVTEFKAVLTESERTVVERCMLSIGVVENKVKTFWSRIDQRMPKSEIASVGYAFGNSEVIHQHTQQKLLELLNLEDKFASIDEVPCMKGRAEYLSKYLKGLNSRSDKEFTKSLILFVFLVENVSLFSQFLIMAGFRKYKNLLTNFNSVIGAIAREETIHANFGEELITIIKKENPEWFDSEMEIKIRGNIKKALKAELEVLDWIFEKGEMSFMPKENIQEYLKDRFNQSLVKIGYKPEFEIDENKLRITEFLDVQIKASSSFDFFNEKSTEYSSNNTAFNGEEEWD